MLHYYYTYYLLIYIFLLDKISLITNQISVIDILFGILISI